MTTAARSWLHAILLTVLVFLASSASAEMNPAELKAFSGYKAKAEKGDPVAQFNLGFCFDTGLGVAKNQVEAVKLYRKAADNGNAAAQNSLGVSYELGKGVAKDEVEAVKWYRKAADQGYDLAQHSLGNCYLYGKGVAKDEVEAYAYFNLAGITEEDARKDLAILDKGMSSDARLRAQQRTKELQNDIEAKIAAKKAGK